MRIECVRSCVRYALWVLVRLLWRRALFPTHLLNKVHSNQLLVCFYLMRITTTHARRQTRRFGRNTSLVKWLPKNMCKESSGGSQVSTRYPSTGYRTSWSTISWSMPTRPYSLFCSWFWCIWPLFQCRIALKASIRPTTCSRTSLLIRTVCSSTELLSCPKCL